MDVRELLPHREPFLFVDRVVERSERAIQTEWRAHAQHDFFRGHYPGRPIVPGVILCESVFQAGALLAAGQLDPAPPPDAAPLLVKISDARFRRPVGPDEILRIEVELDERQGPAFRMTGRVTSAGHSVLRVEFTVALAAPGALAP